MVNTIDISNKGNNNLRSDIIYSFFLKGWKESKYNIMIIPVRIYNIIENYDRFASLDEIYIEDLGLRLVGNLLVYKVYLDLELQPNKMLLSFDKVSKREYIIEHILEDRIFIPTVKIDIIYNLL